MKSKDNSFDIYIKPENGQYMSLQELLDSGVMAFTGSEYVFDDSVNSADVYMTINTNKYMVQSAVGIGASGAITVNKGTTFIQIDNKALTITWAYDKQTYGDDAYLEHGKAYVIAIEGVNDLHSIPFANNPGDSKGGHIAVETGKKVTIKLIPDYGYQIAGVRLNGGETLTPDANNISTFTFVMGDGNVHFKGIFTKAADTISVSGSNAVGQASIQDGSNAAPSGNLRLTVADNKSYNTDSVKNMVKGDLKGDSVTVESKTLYAKLVAATEKRAPQADAVARYVREHKRYPIILCGDFNDNPISYVHHTIAKELTDCYTATGNGPGISYNSNAFFVRIDNIMCSDHFVPYDCSVDRSIKASDHYPIKCWVKRRRN